MRKPVRRVLSILALLAIISLVGAEIALRKLWGLGDMTIVFQEDTDFEYIAQPNQDKVRFGHRVIYNEHSMRSLPLQDTDECVVLGFGDSVINGGTLTDQDSLATTIVENRYQRDYANGFRFLNISAGSWGPDNCAAYLKKYGSFDAKMIILFVSSHDAHDNMTFEKTVGVHQSYPERPYPLAMFELIDRYIKPRLLGALGDSIGTDGLMINKNGDGFNPGFEFFKNYSRDHNIPLVVCLHAEMKEVEGGKFNEQGEEILAFCAKNDIKVISGLDIGESPSDFRDDIHINESGQKRWASALYTEIYNTIKDCR
jgi:lysophospholipase L1-like esterase